MTKLTRLDSNPNHQLTASGSALRTVGIGAPQIVQLGGSLTNPSKRPDRPGLVTVPFRGMKFLRR